MTNLLTYAEYFAIAEALDPPRSPFIDGKYQRGNGPMMATINPASGAEIAQISTADTTDVDLAVTKARGRLTKAVGQMTPMAQGAISYAIDLQPPRTGGDGERGVGQTNS